MVRASHGPWGLRSVPGSHNVYPASCRHAFTCTVESLRETLATTKRSYEGRLSQSEAALSLKDAEVGVRTGVWQDCECVLTARMFGIRLAPIARFTATGMGEHCMGEG